MLEPWQTFVIMVPMPAQTPLLRTARGGFPVPQALAPDQLPESVKSDLLRLLDGPPKPAVTLAVMEQAQRSMIGPDLPFRANV